MEGEATAAVGAAAEAVEAGVWWDIGMVFFSFFLFPFSLVGGRELWLWVERGGKEGVEWVVFEKSRLGGPFELPGEV